MCRIVNRSTVRSKRTREKRRVRERERESEKQLKPTASNTSSFYRVFGFATRQRTRSIEFCSVLFSYFSLIFSLAHDSFFSGFFICYLLFSFSVPIQFPLFLSILCSSLPDDSLSFYRFPTLPYCLYAGEKSRR